MASIISAANEFKYIMKNNAALVQLPTDTKYPVNINAAT